MTTTRISALRHTLLLMGVASVLFSSMPASAKLTKALRAAGDKMAVNIHITGTITADGSCTFANGGNEEVPFGDIHYSTTNGVISLDKPYKQTLDNKLNCTGDVNGNVTLTMETITGAVDYLGHKLIPVNVAGAPSADLAIELLVNGQVQDINTPFGIDINTPPNLEAELVQNGDGKGLVNDAAIDATATLTLAFL